MVYIVYFKYTRIGVQHIGKRLGLNNDYTDIRLGLLDTLSL